MKITILCVGRFKERYWEAAAGEYMKRLSRYCTIRIAEVTDEPTPEGASEKQEEQIRNKEGARLLSWIQKNAPAATSLVVALALDGERMDSLKFAGSVQKVMGSGIGHLVFVIGGSLGLSDDVLRRADRKLSFSDFTFPHQLMRVILLEQIYRAFRIINHQPYHK